MAAGEGDAGLSHNSLALVFTNSGSTSCVVNGYPGVAGIDSSGRQLVQARRTTGGYLAGNVGAPTTITVQPGGTVSAIVEGVSAAAPDSQCPNVTGLLVTPPGSHVSTRLSSAPSACQGLDVHPVVSGKTGKP